MNKPLIKPNWPAPKNIFSYNTIRYPGLSCNNYHGFNLGLHVGDNRQDVITNRKDLITYAALPAEPKWLNQIHSNQVICAEDITSNSQADASYTQQKNIICTIMSADCLPILVTNQQGSEVAAIHAGWRSLANGIIENTLDKFQSPREECMAWLGPRISWDNFEVGLEVYEAFNQYHCEKTFIKLKNSQKWHANLAYLAEQILNQSKIIDVYDSQLCTYSTPQQFYSYRRDKETGRMATLIWIADL